LSSVAVRSLGCNLRCTPYLETGVSAARAVGHSSPVIRVRHAAWVTAVLSAALAPTSCSGSAPLGGSAKPIEHRHTPDLLPPPADPALTYALTTNGRTAANVSNGNYAFFRARPGQHVLVKVVLTARLCSAYCRRHLTTVGSVHPTRSAICGSVSPSAASNTIRARSGTRAGAPRSRARFSSFARSESG